MPFIFNFEDYELYCKLFELKPSHYDTLKKFSKFVIQSEIDVLMLRRW